MHVIPDSSESVVVIDHEKPVDAGELLSADMSSDASSCTSSSYDDRLRNDADATERECDTARSSPVSVSSQVPPAVDVSSLILDECASQLEETEMDRKIGPALQDSASVEVVLKFSIESVETIPEQSFEASNSSMDSPKEEENSSCSSITAVTTTATTEDSQCHATNSESEGRADAEPLAHSSNSSLHAPTSTDVISAAEIDSSSSPMHIKKGEPMAVPPDYFEEEKKDEEDLGSPSGKENGPECQQPTLSPTSVKITSPQETLNETTVNSAGSSPSNPSAPASASNSEHDSMERVHSNVESPDRLPRPSPNATAPASTPPSTKREESPPRSRVNSPIRSRTKTPPRQRTKTPPRQRTNTPPRSRTSVPTETVNNEPPVNTPLRPKTPPRSRSPPPKAEPKPRKKLSEYIRRDLWKRGDPAVVLEALEAIAEAAERPEACGSIARTGGLLAIVRAMEDNVAHAGIQIAACSCLEKLALDPENELAIAEVGGVDAVLGAMMCHFQNEVVHEAAWSTLWNLTCLNSADRMTIDTTGGMQVIVSCMKQHSGSAAVQKNACGALTNLCLHNEARLESLVAAGGLVAIASALQKHWKNPAVRAQASHALTALLESHAEDDYEDRTGAIGDVDE